MSTVANLPIEHKLGDTIKRVINLKRRKRLSLEIEPYDLTGCSVQLRVAGATVLTAACDVVDAKLGKIGVPVSTVISAIGEKAYSIVITHTGGEIRTHTEGVITTTARASG